MLRLENLAKLYGLKVVFKGVSCRFTAGSITLLAAVKRQLTPLKTTLRP